MVLGSKFAFADREGHGTLGKKLQQAKRKSQEQPPKFRTIQGGGQEGVFSH